jgi:hypothetical protein
MKTPDYRKISQKMQAQFRAGPRPKCSQVLGVDGPWLVGLAGWRMRRKHGAYKPLALALIALLLNGCRP